MIRNMQTCIACREEISGWEKVKNDLGGEGEGGERCGAGVSGNLTTSLSYTYVHTRAVHGVQREDRTENPSTTTTKIQRWMAAQNAVRKSAGQKTTFSSRDGKREKRSVGIFFFLPPQLSSLPPSLPSSSLLYMLDPFLPWISASARVVSVLERSSPDQQQQQHQHHWRDRRLLYVPLHFYPVRICLDCMDEVERFLRTSLRYWQTFWLDDSLLLLGRRSTTRQVSQAFPFFLLEGCNPQFFCFRHVFFFFSWSCCDSFAVAATTYAYVHVRRKGENSRSKKGEEAKFL